MSTQKHAPTGSCQGNPEIGLEICTHTCGCVPPSNALVRGCRKPKFLRLSPLYVKEGGAAKSHITNHEWHQQCGPHFPVFGNPGKGRELTDEEYTAWTPHLGHAKELHCHIPMKYHHLLPDEPQPDYEGALPPHPFLSASYHCFSTPSHHLPAILIPRRQPHSPRPPPRPPPAKPSPSPAATCSGSCYVCRTSSRAHLVRLCRPRCPTNGLLCWGSANWGLELNSGGVQGVAIVLHLCRCGANLFKQKHHRDSRSSNDCSSRLCISGTAGQR